MAKRYCFTLNNPTSCEENDLMNSDAFEYLLYGFEVGEKEKTPHLQGFCVLKKKSQLTALKKISPRAHWEKVRGSNSDNISYCTKGGAYLEFGDRSRYAGIDQGSRTDISLLLQAIKDGQDRKTVCEQFFREWLKYSRAIEATYALFRTDRQPTRDTIVDLYYGATGTGKSRHAFLTYPDAYVHSTGRWWDGYDSQSVVILDDYRSDIAFHQLLRIIDRYPTHVETKGGTRLVKATRFVFTSTKMPSEWYRFSQLGEDPQQLHRRIHNFYDFDEPNPRTGEAFTVSPYRAE